MHRRHRTIDRNIPIPHNGIQEILQLPRLQTQTLPKEKQKNRMDLIPILQPISINETIRHQQILKHLPRRRRKTRDPLHDEIQRPQRKRIHLTHSHQELLLIIRASPIHRLIQETIHLLILIIREEIRKTPPLLHRLHMLRIRDIPPHIQTNRRNPTIGSGKKLLTIGHRNHKPILTEKSQNILRRKSQILTPYLRSQPLQLQILHRHRQTNPRQKHHMQMPHLPPRQKLHKPPASLIRKHMAIIQHEIHRTLESKRIEKRKQLIELPLRRRQPHLRDPIRHSRRKRTQKSPHLLPEKRRRITHQRLPYRIGRQRLSGSQSLPIANRRHHAKERKLQSTADPRHKQRPLEKRGGRNLSHNVSISC